MLLLFYLPKGQNLDLMSLDYNIQKGRNGAPLHHFTPFPTSFSDGVNVFTQDFAVYDGERVNTYVPTNFTYRPFIATLMGVLGPIWYRFSGPLLMQCQEESRN